MFDNIILYTLPVLVIAVTGMLVFYFVIKKFRMQARQTRELVAQVQQFSVHTEHLTRQLQEVQAKLSALADGADAAEKVQLKFQQKLNERYEAQVEVLDTKLITFNEQLDRLVNQEPQDKLYSRAAKLASMGASQQEIVEECGILSAEADMLLSIHQKS